MKTELYQENFNIKLNYFVLTEKKPGKVYFLPMF